LHQVCLQVGRSLHNVRVIEALRQKVVLGQLNPEIVKRRHALARDLSILDGAKNKAPEQILIRCDDFYSDYSLLNGLLKSLRCEVDISAGHDKDVKNRPTSFYVSWSRKDHQSATEPLLDSSPAVAEILTLSREAYLDGHHRKALGLAYEAKGLLWPDAAVATQLLKGLLQFPHYAPIANVFAEIPSEMMTDEIRMLKARWHWVNESLTEVREALNSVPEGTRNRSYQMALYHMDQYARHGKHMRDLELAHGYFLKEVTSFPRSWWARVCFSIPCRLIPSRVNRESDETAKIHLEEDIEAHPENSAPRFFRLFHAMILGRSIKNIGAIVDRDIRDCPQSMEVPGDLLQLIDEPLRLLFEPKRVADLTMQLHRWMGAFTTLL